jgi:hypothetical protein
MLRRTALCSMLLMVVSTAWATQSVQVSLKDKLVGTWALVSFAQEMWDGEIRDAFGRDPRGLMTFDRNGTMTHVILGADRSKFASYDRLTGSAQENQAVVRSTQAFFGRYSVNESDNTVIFHVERSSYPNWDGTDQSSIMEIEGDELRQIKTRGSSSVGHSVWRRVQ